MTGHLSVVGQAVVDHRFRVPAFSASGGKQQASDHQVEAGGLATNAARAALRLRGPAGPAIRLHAAVGDDPDGHWLLAAFRSEGLDTVGVAVVPSARTGVSAVLVDASGERQVHNYRGDAAERAEPPRPEHFDGSAGVLVDPRWPAAAEVALRWARAQRVVSVLDAEVAPANTLQLLAPLARWVVFSAAGLAAWAGAHDEGGATASSSSVRIQLRLQRAAAACPGSEIIVTLGGQGLLWCRSGDRVVAWPAFEVPVVDTNGAGDVFHGALALALTQGLGPLAAVRRAMGAAALACARAGGASAAPGPEELDHFLKDKP